MLAQVFIKNAPSAHGCVPLVEWGVVCFKTNRRGIIRKINTSNLISEQP